MMITEGDSITTNYLRNAILKNCTNVTIVPTPFLYDINVFNECEEEGNILIKEDFWIPYGIL